jgi:hypothetical protein
MSSPRIVYVRRLEATTESELIVLANVYAYLIKTHHSKKAAKPARPKTGEEEFHTKEGGPNDLERNAIHGAEGDRPEQIGKDKHGFVHR